MNRLHL
jgi:hypothetical protein